jgi:hypothetical protein
MLFALCDNYSGKKKITVLVKIGISYLKFSTAYLYFCKRIKLIENHFHEYGNNMILPYLKTADQAGVSEEENIRIARKFIQKLLMSISN